MREIRLKRVLMGMPITVAVVGDCDRPTMDSVFAYFAAVDRRFSTYRADSEISAINRGDLDEAHCSAEMQEVLSLAEQTRRQTDGFFDIRKADGSLDPSGIVKGWAIRNAAAILTGSGIRDFFVDAGGDVQSSGQSDSGEEWRIGIRSPFDATEIIKVVCPGGRGVATSGTYVRGQHIYDPHAPLRAIPLIVSLTVIGPDILEADRFATAAFAMGERGISFIEEMPDLEGYLVRANGRATLTSGFSQFCRS